MQKQKKILTVAMVLTLILLSLSLASCGKDSHTHKYDEVWKSNDDYHWQECECGAMQNKTSHEFVTKTDAVYHWQECKCGAIKDKTSHEFVSKTDADNHWAECECGIIIHEEEHIFNQKKVDARYIADNGSSYYYSCVCGAKGTETFTVVLDETSEDGKIHLVFQCYMNGRVEELVTKYVAKFEQDYPEYKVDIVNDSTEADKIVKSFGQAGQPNVIYCTPDNLGTFLDGSIVQSLDEYINDKNIGLTSSQRSDFVEGFVIKTDGEVYSLPFSRSTDVMYYNKTFFKENHLQVPTTWAEMESVCAEINSMSNNILCPLAYDNASGLFVNMSEQYGGGYVKGGVPAYVNPQNRQFAEMLVEWHDKGYLEIGGYSSSMFLAQNCYMSIASSSAWSYYNTNDFEVGVAPLPQADKQSEKVLAVGGDLCVLKSTPKKNEGSWLLLKYLTANTDFATEYCVSSGNIPTLQSVVASDGFNMAIFGNTLWQEVINACYSTQGYFMLPAIAGIQQLHAKLGDMLCECFKKGMNEFV